MKLTILGASGRTGTHLVEQALAAGHDVVALIRNPAKLTLRHERLRITQGELTDEVAVEAAVRGADAVLAALSPKIFGGPRDLPLASGRAPSWPRCAHTASAGSSTAGARAS